MSASLETNPPMDHVDCGLFYYMDPWVLTVFYFLSLMWLMDDGCVGFGQTWLYSFSWAKLNCPGQTATDTVKECNKIQIQLRSAIKSPHYQNGRHVLLWAIPGNYSIFQAFSGYFRLSPDIPGYFNLYQSVQQNSFFLLLAVALRLWSCALKRLLPLGVEGHLKTHSVGFDFKLPEINNGFGHADFI